MKPIILLAELQNLDTRIDENATARAALQKHLADVGTLTAARDQADAFDKRVHELRARLRSLELETSGLEEKIKQVAQRLYSGHITNPKELDGLSRDEAMLKRRKAELEDQELELMAQLEVAEKLAHEKRQAYEQLAAQWDAAAARDRAALQELDHRDAELTRKRAALRAQLSADALALYDDLRRTKKGRAVASIKNSACSVCGYAVPSGLASRVKLEDELIFCPNCGRILAP